MRSFKEWLMAAMIALAAAAEAMGAGAWDGRPRITTNPTLVAAQAGTETVMYVRACGMGPLSFQWHREGTPVPGAVEPVLRLGAPASVQAGLYQCVVANPYGRATSDVGRVSVPGGFLPAGIFSCNVVGYVNVYLQPGFTLVVIPLARTDPGGDTLAQQFGWLPDGVTIHQVTSNGFAAQARLGGWREPGKRLPFGEVFFAFNPYDQPVVQTFVGAVISGELRQTLPGGYSVAGSLVPQAGGVSTMLQMPVHTGDEVWRWDPASQSYLDYYFQDDWQPREPSVSVAEAFVVRKRFAEVWRRFFAVALLPGECDPDPAASGPLERIPMTTVPGQLHFFTYHPDPAFGRVEGAGNGFFGQLYVGLSTNENALWPAGVPVRFLDGAAAGYLDGGIVSLPELPGGHVVQAQLRIWSGFDGASYEAAQAAGCPSARSEVVSVRTASPLVGGLPSIPPRPVNHFRSLQLAGAPRLSAEPASLAAPVGGSVSFSASVPGGGASSFQWRHNGTVIPGATGALLQLTNLGMGHAGDYSVAVPNGNCTTSSTNAHLIVFRPITLLSPPVDVHCVAGDRAQFTVQAEGEPPLTYQWHWSSADTHITQRLTGTTNATLILSNIVDLTEGDFWVEVRSPYEAVTTAPARLEVTNFLHHVLDTPGLAYVTGGDQAWRAAGPPFLERTNVATVGPTYLAWMETQVNGPAVVAFWWAVAVSQPPHALRCEVNGSIQASHAGSPGWQSAAVPLPAGSHRVRWQLRDALSAWVDAVEVRPGLAPTIVQTSSNVWSAPGQWVQLSVQAVGDPTLRYQWFAGPNPISNFGPDLLLPPWRTLPDPPYSVVVSNYFGTAVSGPLLVRPAPTLRLLPAAEGGYRLEWPSEAAGFVPESSIELTGGAPWIRVEQPITCRDSNCFVLLPPQTTSLRWFRLRLP